MDRLPRPPLHLARRVGDLDPGDPWDHYEQIGEWLRAVIVSNLPPGWDWEGRRALDFGCGAGRTMRAFAPETQAAEFWGCDIDEPSIAWMREHLAPPFHPFLVTETPRIPRPDAFFDLIWAMSVFTHLPETWSGWLAELHRTLADGGILIATFLGQGMWEGMESDPWPGQEIGMCVLRAGQPWNIGGPTVYHSEWWLREHFGRAFEIVSIDPGAEPSAHGLVVLRKRPGEITPDDLERAADDPRELRALQLNLELLHAEDRRLRPRYLRLVGDRARRALAYGLRSGVGRVRRLATRRR